MSTDPLSIIKTVASALKNLKDAVELVSTNLFHIFLNEATNYSFLDPYHSFPRMKKIFMHLCPSLSMKRRTS